MWGERRLRELLRPVVLLQVRVDRLRALVVLLRALVVLHPVRVLRAPRIALNTNKTAELR